MVIFYASSSHQQQQHHSHQYFLLFIVLVNFTWLLIKRESLSHLPTSCVIAAPATRLTILSINVTNVAITIQFHHQTYLVQFHLQNCHILRVRINDVEPRRQCIHEVDVVLFGRFYEHPQLIWSTKKKQLFFITHQYHQNKVQIYSTDIPVTQNFYNFWMMVLQLCQVLKQLKQKPQ